jgi:inorganic phosphate transporter, PiT family
MGGRGKRIDMNAGALALPILIGLIIVALAFDFLNGVHDAANSIATIVSTRVLRPQHAVAWAAFFNFVAFLVFGAHVAQTVGTGIISADIVDARVIFAALMGAIVWNVITWAIGIPSSSSHALIGGLVGAGVAKVGISAVVWDGLAKTTAGIVLSPLGGFILAMLIFLVASWLFARSTPHAVDRLFRSLQFVSASLYSLGHGGNDAQKTMGIISVLLYSQGYLDEFHVPFWVMFSCYAAMGLGTLIGGWRIVRTMGSRITRLTPFQGFCAETGGAITLFAATELGVPVSTTHTITGCIVGVGAARRVSAVRWSVANSIVVAWIITIPASAFIAALAYGIVGLSG